MEREVWVFMHEGDEKSVLLKKEISKYQDTGKFKLRIIYADRYNVPIYERHSISSMPTTLIVNEDEKEVCRYVGNSLIESVGMFLSKCGL